MATGSAFSQLVLALGIDGETVGPTANNGITIRGTNAGIRKDIQTDAAGNLTFVPAAGALSDVNVKQVGGTAVTTGSGVLGVGTQRVVLAIDQPVIPVSDNAGSLTVDAPVGTPAAVRLSDGVAFLTTSGGRLAVTSTQAGAEWRDNLMSLASVALAAPFDMNSGVGTENILGVTLRKSTSVGSVEYGTATDPVRVDPTGTTAQPISAASLPLPAGAATETTLATRAADATLTGGTAKAIARGAAKGTTVAADATVKAIDANTNSLTVDGSAVTQPVSAASLPLPAGASTEATLALVKAKTDALDVLLSTRTKPADTQIVGDGGGSLTVDAPVGTPVAVRVSDGVAFISPATDRTTAAGPFATRLTDGVAFYDATKTGQLPTALVGGRLDENVGAWLGSTAPTVGSKTSLNSIPVVVASDQGVIPISDNAGSLTVDAPVGTPVAARLSDGVAFYDGAKTGQLPAALVGGRLDDNVGSWLGSTAPTVGSKTSANSVPVVVASDQGNVAVSQATAASLNATVTQGPASSSAAWLVDQRRALALAFASVDIATAGDNTIVAADATKKIKLLSYTLVVDTAVAVRWKSGAGTNLSGAMSFAANGGVSSPMGTPAGGWLLETAVNQALVLNLSAAVGLRGHASYFLEA